jgi:hypothetical protein
VASSGKEEAAQTSENASEKNEEASQEKEERAAARSITLPVFAALLMRAADM